MASCVQNKLEQLGAIEAISAYLQADQNTTPETNFELGQNLVSVFPPNQCEFDVVEEAVTVFGALLNSYYPVSSRQFWQERSSVAASVCCGRSSMPPRVRTAPSSTSSTVRNLLQFGTSIKRFQTAPSCGDSMPCWSSRFSPASSPL